MSRYMKEVVARYFKLVVLLLVVTAVATILLTPTPTDDVPGVMHQSHSPVAVAVAIGLVQAVALINSTQRLQNSPSRQLLSPNFLELVCQHLC
jgi:undecaprenyl pyrophosphate phosphatase UppP